MSNRHILLWTAVVLFLFGLVGPIGRRVGAASDSVWWPVVAWLVIIAAWLYIGPELWRRWKESRQDEG